MWSSSQLGLGGASVDRGFASFETVRVFSSSLLKVITLFSPLRIFAPLSVASFVLDGLYGVWTVVHHARIPNGAVLLLMFSVVVFLVGLVSEQISSLRFEGRR
jgi:predicted membrane channel-forming protein YqfA (hemolysin III family)